jgi:hypothetical protein
MLQTYCLSFYNPSLYTLFGCLDHVLGLTCVVSFFFKSNISCNDLKG